MDSERIAVRTDVQVLAKLGWVLTEAECVERFVGPVFRDMRELPGPLREQRRETPVSRPLNTDPNYPDPPGTSLLPK